LFAVGTVQLQRPNGERYFPDRFLGHWRSRDLGLFSPTPQAQKPHTLSLAPAGVQEDDVLRHPYHSPVSHPQRVQWPDPIVVAILRLQWRVAGGGRRQLDGLLSRYN